MQRSSQGSGGGRHDLSLAWSDWKWNEEAQLEVRYRQVSDGEWEYQERLLARVEPKAASVPRPQNSLVDIQETSEQVQDSPVQDESPIQDATLTGYAPRHLGVDPAPIETISSGSSNYRYDDDCGRVLDTSSTNYGVEDGFRYDSHRPLDTLHEPQSSTKSADVVEEKESSDSANISEGLGSLRVSEQTSTVKVGISDSVPKYNPGSSVTPVDTSRVLCTWPSCSESFIRISDRDRHYQTIHANNGDRPYKCSIEGCSANVRSWARIEKLRAHNKIWHGPYHCSVEGCSRGFPCGFGSQQDLDEHKLKAHSGGRRPSPENKMLSQLRSSDSSQTSSPPLFSSQDALPASASFEETRSPSVPLPLGPQDSPLTSTTPLTDFRDAPPTPVKGKEPQLDSLTFQYTASSAISEIYASYTPTYSSYTPAYASHDEARRIYTRNIDTTAEKSDRNFKVHRSKDFRFGQVFKVLWSEPVGKGGTEITERGGKKGSFQKQRRFVVVDSRKGHSMCLPIMTYGGQGTLKYGVHPEDHAPIYSSKREGPCILEGEAMTHRPIRVDVIDPSHKLDPMSRLNYAKIYTVEHNVKVWFIGQVANGLYEQKLVDAYNATHRPLPDRPDQTAEITDYTFQHAEGPDPEYPQAMGQYSSSWSGQEGQDPNYPQVTGPVSSWTGQEGQDPNYPQVTGVVSSWVGESSTEPPADYDNSQDQYSLSWTGDPSKEPPATDYVNSYDEYESPPNLYDAEE